MAKHPGGRPTKYRPEYCQGIVDYFQSYYKNLKNRSSLELPYFFEYAESIGVCDDTLTEWASVHPEFSAAYKKAKEIVKECLIFGGTSGIFNATFTIFTAKNITDMRDKTEQEHTGSININVVNYTDSNSSA